MVAKLTTTVAKIPSVPNKTNAALIEDFRIYMRSNGSSDNNQNNNLKAVIAFAKFLGPNVSFYQLEKREQILAYLDTKIKSQEEDPDKRWIATWNDYLSRIKHFIRWLYNFRLSDKGSSNDVTYADWEPPEFARIKLKRTKRLSPYSETEIWEKHELLSVIKYEPSKRNKAALALMWDLDARNHEVTLLKMKHLRLKENYAEGEIPHESKTGSGPILHTFSFPYVRDWLNEHPLKNEPDAPVICNLHTAGTVRPDALWRIMMQLRSGISRMLEDGAISDPDEQQEMRRLLRRKRWNPYCIRHSAITADSDFLPEYALKKKVR